MNRRVVFALAVALLAGVTWAIAQQLEDTFYIPLDDPAIQYGQRPFNDPVARLEQRMEKGQIKLEAAPNGWGYLPSVLKQLGINRDSQALVFSKTSTQVENIGPRTPRAIYFNDDVLVGFVRNSDVLEIASLDPKQGVQFYVLVRAAEPAFAPSQGCLRCHQGAVTLGVPGLVISSVHPVSQTRSEHGNAFMTDHRSPLSGRWGGWYVTGTTGSQTHLGNNTNLVDPVRSGGPSSEPTQNLTSLETMLDTSKYLEPTSDIVALMTLEHQTGFIDRAAALNVTGSDAALNDLVSYMTYGDEVALPGPVAGDSGFAAEFAARGPRDSQGRSLRDFDLKTRLFRYPLSYMIYSGAFDALKPQIKAKLWRKLYDTLKTRPGGNDAIAIAAATRPGLPDYWK